MKRLMATLSFSLVGLIACSDSEPGADAPPAAIDARPASDAPTVGDARPNDAPPTPAATLTQLQTDIFTPRCTGCHGGATPAASMSLASGSTYTSTVNVMSGEIAALKRILPGDPANSYLVQKVEGASGILGAQMPRGLPPLSADDIAKIRSWVAAGAANN